MLRHNYAWDYLVKIEITTHCHSGCSVPTTNDSYCCFLPAVNLSTTTSPDLPTCPCCSRISTSVFPTYLSTTIPPTTDVSSPGGSSISGRLDSKGEQQQSDDIIELRSWLLDSTTLLLWITNLSLGCAVLLGGFCSLVNSSIHYFYKARGTR